MSEIDAEGMPPAEDNREFAVAGLAQDAIEAELLKGFCEEAGIDAFVDAARDGMVEKLSAVSEKFEIRVPLRDVEKAKVIIAERKAAIEADPEGWAKAAEDEERATEEKPA